MTDEPQLSEAARKVLQEMWACTDPLPERPAPEYVTFNMEDVGDALQEVRHQFLRGKPLVWNGPDKLHYSVAATSPEPSWHFSTEGMSYHEEQGRDFWDVWILVAFQVGFHNGYVRAEGLQPRRS